jgi:hypothetical protein
VFSKYERFILFGMVSFNLDGKEQAYLPGWAIGWRLMFRVKNREKAQRKIEEVRQTFGRDIEVSTSERYWEDESLWDCWVRVPGANGSPADLVFDCLVLAARLGSGWYIDGLGGDGDLAVFNGVFDASRSGRPHVSGLVWASFDLIAPRSET